MNEIPRAIGSVLLASALALTGVVAVAAPAQASPSALHAEKSKKKWVKYRVSPGAFCSERGWYGKTRTGLVMRCKTTSSDSRYRWRQ